MSAFGFLISESLTRSISEIHAEWRGWRHRFCSQCFHWLHMMSKVCQTSNYHVPVAQFWVWDVLGFGGSKTGQKWKLTILAIIRIGSWWSRWGLKGLWRSPCQCNRKLGLDCCSRRKWGKSPILERQLCGHFSDLRTRSLYITYACQMNRNDLNFQNLP